MNNYATSTIHNYLNNTYCNTLPTQDREKLSAKAVRQEFHGNGTYTFKLLYGWGTINASVWLPSLCELVGFDPNNYDATRGTYYAAMQGLNTSNAWHVDVQGGNQFAYFKAYNASGGGDAIWTACGQKMSWLRSASYAYTTNAWRTTNPTALNAPLVTYSYAVHPAVE